MFLLTVFIWINSSCIKQSGFNYFVNETPEEFDVLKDPNFLNNLVIGQIQGEGHISPYIGKKVKNLVGVVTAIRDNGFYIQSSNSDSNKHTSDAIFIHI